jgi:hypothetical protein
MAEEDAPGAAEETKSCPVCAEPILLPARKCIHCGSRLDWLRFFGASTTTLALATALIAVIGQVAPVVRTASQPKDSRFHFVFMGAGGGRAMLNESVVHGDVVLVSTNDGTKAGAIVTGFLTVKWTCPSGRTCGLAIPLRTLNDEPQIVGPGSATGVRLYIQPEVELGNGTTSDNAKSLIRPAVADNVMTAPIEHADCRVDITVANASGSEQGFPVRARCDAVFPYVANAIQYPGT